MALRLRLERDESWRTHVLVRSSSSLDTGGRFLGHAAISWLALLAVFSISCGLRQHKIDFGAMDQADRIEIQDHSAKRVATITEPAAILAAARFIAEYRSGWADHWSGPQVPKFMLHFYRSGTYINGFGIGFGFIASNPTTDGFWSRDVPVEKINALLREMRLEEMSGKK